MTNVITEFHINGNSVPREHYIATYQREFKKLVCYHTGFFDHLGRFHESYNLFL